MKAIPAPDTPTRRGPLRRVPVAGWIALGVVLFHVVAFWLLSDKHFLPKARYVPPPPPINFGSHQQTHVDPSTGEVTRETSYTVSTTLASPTPTSSR